MTRQYQTTSGCAAAALKSEIDSTPGLHRPEPPWIAWRPSAEHSTKLHLSLGEEGGAILSDLFNRNCCRHYRRHIKSSARCQMMQTCSNLPVISRTAWSISPMATVTFMTFCHPAAVMSRRIRVAQLHPNSVSQLSKSAVYNRSINPSFMRRLSF